MAVRAEAAGYQSSAELSPDQERLLAFVRANAPAGPIGLAIVLLLWWLSPSSNPLYPILAFGTIVNWALVWSTPRLIRQNRLRTSIFMIASGMWSLGLGLAVLVPTGFALTTIVAVLPIAVSVAFSGTYIGRPLLLRIIIGSTAVTAVGTAFTLFPPLWPIDESLSYAVLCVLHVTVAALVASAGLALWNESQRVVETLTELRVTNRALEESEHLLERKVEERTAQLADKNLALEDSERKLAEARDAALDASRAKSDFLANMSHELRTPLNAIIGYSEMLQDEARDGGQDAFIPDLDKILSSGRYLLTLINGVLDLSKIEAGKMDLYLEDFDVAELIEGVVGTIQPLIQKNANRLETAGLEQLGSMHSDSTKLRQTLFNLLSNASKFTQSGTITLRAAREQRDGADWLRFSVTDSGIGMTEEQLGRVFEAFSQADATTTRQYGGTGLGLAITRQFCGLLGGEINAQSEPGVGSTFEIRLPARALEKQPEHHAAAAFDAQPSESALRVLAVDDDPDALDLISRHLERSGMVALTASSGAEALRLAREQRPDAITLDVVMPGMDGWEVLRALKADPELAGIPVILLTMLEDKNLGYALGAAEYLSKPVDWERLHAVLEQLVGGAETQTVLVIDDDPLARDMLRRGVERAGFRSIEAENGLVALEQVSQGKPSLILLDLMMPEMDGFEFVSELRGRPDGADIPVVVITAKEVTAQDRERLDGSVARILQKGAYNRSDLIQEIRRLTSNRTETRGR